jgi:Rrf2 family transcriptional regulator, nitric oxide-sensitive transcriptional repressor
MRLTRFTDYSLRLLIYLACEPGRRATIGEIARAFEISENHLTKVAHFLGQQGWVATVRGKGGGLALACDAADVGVGDVVRRTEGTDLPAECFGDDSGHCAILRACRLKGALAEAAAAFHAVLDGYTLADLVAPRATLSRMLFIGRERPRAPTGRDLT